MLRMFNDFQCKLQQLCNFLIEINEMFFIILCIFKRPFTHLQVVLIVHFWQFLIRPGNHVVVPIFSLYISSFLSQYFSYRQKVIKYRWQEQTCNDETQMSKILNLLDFFSYQFSVKGFWYDVLKRRFKKIMNAVL